MTRSYSDPKKQKVAESLTKASPILKSARSPDLDGVSQEGFPRVGHRFSHLVDNNVQSSRSEMIQAKRRAGSVSPGEIHTAARIGISGIAGKLPHMERIQRSFGHHDVSGIHAHTDRTASDGSLAMGAKAFAMGNHIAFADAPDLHTAAHEAAHIIQQRGGVQLAGGIGQAGDRYERDADAVADRVVRGHSSEGQLDAYIQSAPGKIHPGSARPEVVQRGGGMSQDDDYEIMKKIVVRDKAYAKFEIKLAEKVHEEKITEDEAAMLAAIAKDDDEILLKHHRPGEQWVQHGSNIMLELAQERLKPRGDRERAKIVKGARDPRVFKVIDVYKAFHGR